MPHPTKRQITDAMRVLGRIGGSAVTAKKSKSSAENAKKARAARAAKKAAA